MIAKGSGINFVSVTSTVGIGILGVGRRVLLLGGSGFLGTGVIVGGGVAFGGEVTISVKDLNKVIIGRKRILETSLKWILAQRRVIRVRKTTEQRTKVAKGRARVLIRTTGRGRDRVVGNRHGEEPRKFLKLENFTGPSRRLVAEKLVPRIVCSSRSKSEEND